MRLFCHGLKREISVSSALRKLVLLLIISQYPWFWNIGFLRDHISNWIPLHFCCHAKEYIRISKQDMCTVHKMCIVKLKIAERIKDYYRLLIVATIAAMTWKFSANSQATRISGPAKKCQWLTTLPADRIGNGREREGGKRIRRGIEEEVEASYSPRQLSRTRQRPVEKAW